MNVLHLEDDGPLNEVLRTVLTMVEPSIHMQQFMNSDDTMRHIEQHGQEIDLFILDIRVPGALNGLQVAQRIRELGCPGAIVLTSAYSMPDQAFMTAMDLKWVPKPWHVIDLPNQLLSLIQ